MPVISLAELRSYAEKNSDIEYDVTSVRSCLACQMLKEQFPGAGVQWVPEGSVDIPDSLHASYMKVDVPGPEHEQKRYGIPSAYIDWCVGVQDAVDNSYNNDKPAKNWYSGAELVRIIDKLNDETVTL